MAQKVLIILLVGFLTPLFGVAQKVDSLKHLLPGSLGLVRCQILYDIAYEYSEVDDSLSLVFAKEALSLATELNDSTLMVKTGRITAAQYRRLAYFDTSVNLSKSTLELCRAFGLESEEKLLLNSLGIAYTELGYYDSALFYHQESLDLRNKGGDQFEIEVTLNNLGLVYYRIGNYEKAIEYLLRSLQIKKDNNIDRDHILNMCNLSLAYGELGQPYKQIHYANEAIKYCTPDCTDKELLEAYHSLGRAYLRLEDHKTAIKFSGLANQLSKKMGYTKYAILTEMDIAKAKWNLPGSDKQQILSELKEIEILTIKKSSPLLLKLIVYSNMHEFYYKVGDLENAAMYQSKYLQVYHKLRSINSINSIGFISSVIDSPVKIIENTDSTNKPNSKSINFLLVSSVILCFAGLCFYLIANRKLKSYRTNSERSF